MEHHDTKPGPHTDKMPAPGWGGVRGGLVALIVGLMVGGLTSPGQTLLGDTALSGLVNAVAPWLMAPFLMASSARGVGVAAWVGAVACVAQVPGYYLVAATRGFSSSTGWVTVWSVAGIAGGVVFGVAGWSWRHGTGRWRGLGAALLVAVWLTEGVFVFGVNLGYNANAVVSCGVAVLLVLLLGRRHRQRLAIVYWALPATAAGTLAFAAMSSILSTGF